MTKVFERGYCDSDSRVDSGWCLPELQCEVITITANKFV